MVAGAISELVGDAKMSANPGVSGNGPFHGMSEEVGQAASLVDLSARRAVEHDGVNLVIVEHPARDVFGEVSAWAEVSVGFVLVLVGGWAFLRASRLVVHTHEHGHGHEGHGGEEEEREASEYDDMN